VADGYRSAAHFFWTLFVDQGLRLDSKDSMPMFPPDAMTYRWKFYFILHTAKNQQLSCASLPTA